MSRRNQNIPVKPKSSSKNKKKKENKDNLIINLEEKEDDKDLLDLGSRRKGLLAKLKVPQKRQRTMKDRLFLQLKRKKSGKKQPSEFQQILNKIYAKKAESPEEITSVIASMGKIVSDVDTRNLLNIFAKIKVQNSVIRLRDNLSTVSLHSYMILTFDEVKVLSNDVLYLWSILTDSVLDYPQDIKEIVAISDFAKVSIASQLFSFDGDIIKGYYQDFTGDFCAIGVDKVDQKVREELFKMTENEELGIVVKEFQYQDKNYVVCGNKEACIIVDENNTKNVANLFKNMVIFYGNSGEKIELRERIVAIKDKPKFIDCKLKGERFCPCFMYLPEPIKISMLYKLKLDNNKLFEYWDNLVTNKGAITGPENVLYWDNLDDFFDYLQIYLLTSAVGQILDKEKKAVESYLKYKYAINYWKQNQLFFQNIIVEYYNAFNNKIKYDKLTNLYQKVNKYLETRALLMGDETYKYVQETFMKIEDLCGMIIRQFDPDVLFIANKMRDVLSQIDRGKLDDGEELRRIGYAIYCCSFADNAEIKIAFPIILSPGAFLGDVSEGLKKSPKEFKELIDEFKRSMKTIEIENKDMRDTLTNAMEFGEEGREELIKNTLDEYISKNNLDIGKKNIKTILINLIDRINKAPKLRKEVSLAVAEVLMSNRKVSKEDYLVGDVFKKLIKEEIDKINENVKDKNSPNKKKLNDLKNQKDEIDKKIKITENQIKDNNKNMIREKENEEEENEQSEHEDDKNKGRSRSKSIETHKTNSDNGDDVNISEQNLSLSQSNFRINPQLSNVPQLTKANLNKYAPAQQPESTKSVSSRLSVNYMGKQDLTNQENPADIYKVLANAGMDGGYHLTENNEKMKPETYERLKAHYLIALKNNGIDQLLNKPMGSIDAAMRAYKGRDLNYLLKEYEISDNWINKAFANDDFKLGQAMNELHRYGQRDSHIIDTDNIEKKKATFQE